ncbi:MAG: hypothetical protein COA79_10305 [Planctomycetota bacterium]|nr:MAG: hypothetical protein COA79_10305 [Planctomycetota bacterium]
MRNYIFLILILLFGCGGGGSDETSVSGTNDSTNSTGNDSSSSNNTTSAGFTKKVDVFGISILATNNVSDAKVLHAAKVMASYLDNDDDGVSDNSLILEAMKSAKAYLFMLGSESEQDQVTLPSGEGQLLLEDETRPAGSSSAGFDATLEEVLHLITHLGYANAYPTIFGESSSSLTVAMDVARGGHFTIPNQYPSSAWYTYDDTTCDYSCQATEYFYWSLTSILGAQDYSGRLDDILGEWQLNTSDKVQSTDSLIYALLTDIQYKLPTKIPNRNYSATALTITTP